MDIGRVHQRKDGVRIVVIPKKSKIKAKHGELILMTDNMKLINKFLKEEQNG